MEPAACKSSRNYGSIVRWVMQSSSHQQDDLEFGTGAWLVCIVVKPGEGNEHIGLNMSLIVQQIWAQY